MIRGYASCGFPVKALELYREIMVSEGFEPDQVTYVTVLGVCEQITALQFGMSIHASLIKEGFGLTTMVGTSLIDMYAKCGSFVEIDKRVHRFLVGDKSHEQTEEIHGKLSELRKLVKEAGYKADTSSVLYNVDEGAKEEMLWDHSERLAIAFALLNTGPGTVVRITKNLRVCRDCHVVTKLISKVTGREIVMRDIRRFHHFKDGLCSCGDYW
ncbi:Pentatricopeptide repeat-containing protein At3g57430, chloroplastic [Linum perenne]